jgi:hypothetical protein
MTNMDGGGRAAWEQQLEELTARITVLEAQNHQLRVDQSQMGSEADASASFAVDASFIEGSTSNEASVLRSMLTLQEEIEASLQEENRQLKDQIETQQETLKRWAPIVLGKELNQTTVNLDIEAGRGRHVAFGAVEMPSIAATTTPSVPPASCATSTEHRQRATETEVGTDSTVDAAALKELRSRYTAAGKSPSRSTGKSPARSWAMGAGKPINRTDLPTPLDDSYLLASHHPALSEFYHAVPSPVSSPARAATRHCESTYGSTRTQSTTATAVDTAMEPDESGRSTRSRRSKQRSASKMELEAEVRRILAESKKGISGATDKARAMPFKI